MEYSRRVILHGYPLRWLHFSCAADARLCLVSTVATQLWHHLYMGGELAELPAVEGERDNREDAVVNQKKGRVPFFGAEAPRVSD
jgi:hypothetical protein